MNEHLKLKKKIHVNSNVEETFLNLIQVMLVKICKMAYSLFKKLVLIFLFFTFLEDHKDFKMQ